MKYPLLSRLDNMPVLVCEDRYAQFKACIQGLISHPDAEKLLVDDRVTLGSNDDGFWPQPGTWEARYRPYNVTNGVLQIPVFGTLLNRYGFQVGEYATGYTYIERAVRRGMEDGNVRKIAFIIDSPGGEAAGNFELVDLIYGFRGTKEMRSFAVDHAYSAAYSIFSVGDEGVVTRSGGVGSVGVVVMHVDYSKMLEQDGITVTFIHAGKHKVEGNRYEPLKGEAKKRIQARVDAIYDVFVSTVARNRAMDEKDVRATEALTYDGEDGVKIGFADRVGVFEEEIAAYAADIYDTEEDDEDMKNAATATAVAAALAAIAGGKMTVELFNAAVEEARTEASVAAKAEGVTEGTEAATTRIMGILTHAEAAGREAAAIDFASEPAMTVALAGKALAKMPKAVAPTAEQTDAFKKFMDGQKHPNIDMTAGPGDEQEADPNDTRSESEKAAARINKAYAGASGHGVKAKAA